jgi:DnaJ-class molecular chaperone
MSEEDYKILGILFGADIDTVNKAYRRLAMKYHPDRATGDREWASSQFIAATAARDAIITGLELPPVKVIRACPVCNGKGHVLVGESMWKLKLNCGACYGSGKTSTV